MKKLIAIILLSALSLSSLATEIVITYDGASKRMIINTETKEMKLQVWRASIEDFKNKFSLTNAHIETSKESIRVYSDDSKTREMGTVLKKEGNEVQLSSFLYKNVKYSSIDHENLEQFFDF